MEWERWKKKRVPKPGDRGTGGRSMEPVARSVHSSGMRSVDAGILHIRGCRSTSYALRCQPCRLRAGPWRCGLSSGRFAPIIRGIMSSGKKKRPDINHLPLPARKSVKGRASYLLAVALIVALRYLVYGSRLGIVRRSFAVKSLISQRFNVYIAEICKKILFFKSLRATTLTPLFGSIAVKTHRFPNFRFQQKCHWGRYKLIGIRGIIFAATRTRVTKAISFVVNLLHVSTL